MSTNSKTKIFSVVKIVILLKKEKQEYFKNTNNIQKDIFEASTKKVW